MSSIVNYWSYHVILILPAQLWGDQTKNTDAHHSPWHSLPQYHTDLHETHLLEAEAAPQAAHWWLPVDIMMEVACWLLIGRYCWYTLILVMIIGVLRRHRDITWNSKKKKGGQTMRNQSPLCLMLGSLLYYLLWKQPIVLQYGSRALKHCNIYLAYNDYPS